MATVNINQADVDKLSELAEVGPVLAERIFEYREENDSFDEPDELSKVNGIGDKLLGQIKEKNKVVVRNEDKVEVQTKTIKGERDELDLCPALKNCPFYSNDYCKEDYEQCARYKVFASGLNSQEHLPANILPDDHARVKEILSGDSSN